MELHVFPIPIPPASPPDSSESSQCTRPEYLSHASHLGWWSVYFSNKDARRTILPHPSGPSPISGRWLKHEDSWTLSAIDPDGPMRRYGLIAVFRSMPSYIESTSMSGHNLNAYRASRSHEGVHTAPQGVGVMGKLDSTCPPARHPNPTL